MSIRYKYERMKQAVDTTVDSLRNQEALAEDILKNVVVECLRKYQEKVNVGVQDSLSDLLETFKRKISEEIFDIAQNWALTTAREKTLFPQNCRFLYSIGRSTIVVIEERPATRTLALDKSLLGSEAITTNTGTVERHALPLPYTVFLLHFRNENSMGSGRDTLSALYVYWRKSPLTGLRDPLYIPLLPNIHSNMSVCTGLSDQGMVQGNIVEITNDILSSFWSSAFNCDLSSYWWGKSRIEPRLASVRQWKEHAVEDPLLMLNLDYNEAGTLEDCINICLVAHQEHAPDSAGMRHRLSELIDRSAEKFFEKMMSFFRKTNFERFYPKDLTRQVVESFAIVSEEMSGLVLGIQTELDKMKAEFRRYDKDLEHYGWEPRGEYWSRGE